MDFRGTGGTLVDGIPIWGQTHMAPPQDEPGAGNPACEGQVGGDESVRASRPEAAPSLPSHIGPFAVTGVLGHGGMGIVYAAEDPRLRRPIAIKILAPAAHLDPAGLARFQKEARLLAALNHPNIATIHSLEQHGELHFITMELVSGSTLAERIAQGPMTPAEAVDIGGQIAGALEAAHDAGVIHLDLKPTNIMITPEARVKLLDFGFARASLLSNPSAEAGEDDPTLDLTIQGTPGYMSPEQLRGEQINHRSDIWAFGCLLFEMLAGSPAFPGRTGFDRVAATLKRPPDWGALPDGTPERLRRLIAHCLDKDADHRLGLMSQARRIVEDEAATARGVLPIVPQAPGPEEHPTNLPLQLTTFIGREGPMAELSRHLERTRLVTVAGAGGCGKSRLCIEVGLALVPRFAGGVWLVELAPSPNRAGCRRRWLRRSESGRIRDARSRRPCGGI